MTNPAFPNGPQNRVLARRLQAGILRSPDGTAKTPADMTWQSAGAPYRAPATDPVSEINKLSDEVSEAARNSRLDGVHNGPADAARHALWTAAMTRKHGPTAARLLGAAHEVHGIGKAVAKGEMPAWRETLMDLRNNETGIQMAKEDISNRDLWPKIWKAAEQIPIPETNAEALREGLAGRLVVLPPGEAKSAEWAEYVKAFNDDTPPPRRAPAVKPATPSFADTEAEFSDAFAKQFAAMKAK